MKIVVVTACAGGIAHTYMAAEALKKAGARTGDEIRIEIQGSLGIENELKRAEIENADIVLWANDIAVTRPERFSGKKVIEINPHDAITKPDEVLAKVKKEISST